jgi:hypothetical protein
MENKQKQQAAEEVYRTFAAYQNAQKVARLAGLEIDVNMWNSTVQVFEKLPYNPQTEGREFCTALKTYPATALGATGVVGVRG